MAERDRPNWHMPRQLWLSLALLATGAGLLATARLAPAAPPTPATFRVGMTGASVSIDPQIAYITTAWWLEYATAAKLYNWSDRGTRLVPEVASRVAVSNSGRKYTFFLRKGFRFSDGLPVTARSFSYAFDRAANTELGSPGAQFITDSKGTDIVGARAVNAGEARHVSGVVVKGPYKLVIRLVKPDRTFLSKLTMPFFQATSSKLPLTHDAMDGYPSAGPYFFAGNDVNVLTSIRRNPYWRWKRPAHLAGLDVEWNLNEEMAFQQVETNELDEGPVPAAEVQGLVDRFGVNKTRFWSMPTNCVGVLAFNAHRPLFRRVAMRRAINWAVDRTAFVGQAGVALGTPWTHLLPPLFPGSITKKRLQPYSIHPNLAKARKLAGPNVRHKKITVGYRSSGSIGPAQAKLVRRTLIQLGFRAQNITLKGYSGGDIYTAMGAKGSPLDLAVSLGWCADYPDATNLLSTFLGPPYGVAGSAKYRAKLASVNKLPEPARTRALGRLDLEITNNLAPVAVLRTYNNRYFFSNRVNPGSLAYSSVYQDWSIPALALK
jgi:ABC-type transport system substrate-binding protein